MKRKIFILAAVIIGLVAAGVYFLFGTSAGAVIVMRRTLHSFLDAQRIVVPEPREDLWGGAVFEQVELKDVAGFPVPNTVRIQRAVVRIQGLSLDRVTLEVENLRIFLPYLDPIVVFGRLENGVVDANIFFRILTLDALREFGMPIPSDVDGEVRDADIYFQGPFDRMRISGEALLTRIERQGFVFQNAQTAAELVTDVKGFELKAIDGHITLTQGQLSGTGTAVIDLKEGAVIFDNDPVRPRINIKAASQVQDVKMRIYLRGTMEQPELTVRSNPSFSQNRLLVMLATNAKWEAAEAGLVEQRLSPDIAKEFLDYFLGRYDSGTISPFITWIRGLTIQYDDQGRPVGFSSRISDRVKAGYRVERAPDGEENTSYTVSGGLQITDRFSVEGEKEFMTPDQPDPTSSISEEGEGRVLFKIKQKF